MSNNADNDVKAKINISCPYCLKIINVSIDKTLINNAKSYPASVIYNHCGENILIYVDKQFHARGVEKVDIDMNNRNTTYILNESDKKVIYDKSVIPKIERKTIKVKILRSNNNVMVIDNPND